MLKLILPTLLILVVCFAFLSIKILLKKNGRFPNTHVSSSKAMRDRGIRCVQSQDFEMRHKKGGVAEFKKSYKWKSLTTNPSPKDEGSG